MFRIGTKDIGLQHSPFIIAEMSGNHNHSLDRALEIVEAAANAGAHALKIQTYTADTLTLDINEGDFVIDDKKSLWANRSLYELYQEAHTPWEWHEPIMKLASDLGMLCFSTPFDETAVDFLETLNVPAYKIASFENTHIPLLEKVASTGKPILMSIGMTSEKELKESVNCLRKGGCNQLVLLKCTSNYPATPKNSNILTIPNMREVFDCEVGLSDHTLGIGVAVAAIAHGATVIEKHFTLSRKDGGVDSVFSLEPKEMQQLVIETERAWESLGKIKYGVTKEELKSLKFRQSIYISKDMNKGDKFSKENIRIVRPGFGLLPKYYNEIIGKKVKQDVKKGTALEWGLVE